MLIAGVKFSRSIKLHLYADEDDGNSDIPVKYDGNLALVHVNQQCPTLSVTNKSVIETMRQQLVRCLETHSSYCPSRFDVGPPSRVIDVDSDDNAEGLSLHIRNLRKRGQYAALSYCWGEPPHPFTTTTDLIQDPSQRDWSHSTSSFNSGRRLIDSSTWTARSMG
ncbi:hypothetical protein IFR04_015268 [Cadophora malorum]|uniref:Heterokaryon incompatibility domain-containing protein n=1 Tax=Cadophora malorum TaxID=108018 RepID=A0A8H7T139_9HELO|nr:hypothetical protein IFR04_015268 [Cadophora malorum]